MPGKQQKKTEQDVAEEARQQYIAKIRKSYGDSVVMPGNQMPPISRLPTGSLGMDYILGGGAPWGRMIRPWGGWSSGKSLFFWNLVAQAQDLSRTLYERYESQSKMAKMAGDKALGEELHRLAEVEAERWADGVRVAYFNIENTIDPLQLKAIGVDIDPIDVFTNARIEDIGTMLVEAVDHYNLFCLDSCSQAISVEELAHDSGLYQNHVGIRAKKWSAVLSWVNDKMAGSNDKMVVYIDQIRSPVGMGVGQKMATEEPPGGRLMEHASSATLHFMKGGWLFRRPDGGLDKGEKGDKKEQTAFGRMQPAGKELVIKCVKNKTARQDRVALLHFDMATGNWDPLHEYVNLGKFFGLVTGGKGGWWTLPDGSKTQNLRSTLAEDATLRAAIEHVSLRCARDAVYEQEIRGRISGTDPDDE